MEEQKEQKTVTPAATMAEAGFSINVKMIDPNGQEAQLTFRCALASHSGKLLQHYSGEVKALLASGWSISKPGPRTATAASNGGAAPTCQYHGPMKESDKRPGTYFCPKKMGDGSYCKEKGGSN